MLTDIVGYGWKGIYINAMYLYTFIHINTDCDRRKRAHHNKWRKIHAGSCILLSSQRGYSFSEKSQVIPDVFQMIISHSPDY